MDKPFQRNRKRWVLEDSFQALQVQYPALPHLCSPPPRESRLGSAGSSDVGNTGIPSRGV